MTYSLPTRILLVDDNDVGRYALSRLLRREGSTSSKRRPATRRCGWRPRPASRT